MYQTKMKSYGIIAVIYYWSIAVAYKRKDITIPIAIHYAYNFLGLII